MKNIHHFLKRVMSILVVTCLMIIIAPRTAFAWTCPFELLRGTNEAWAVTQTFTVGEPFDGIGQLNEHYKSGGGAIHTRNREWWVNGLAIKQGYIFTKPGDFLMTMRTDGLVATYNFQVIPQLTQPWANIESLSVATNTIKESYRQGRDPFDVKDLVVKCNYRNGKSEDLRHEDLEFFAGNRGIKSYKDGAVSYNGSRFWNPGEKDLIIRVANKSITIPFNVTPFIQSVKMSKVPPNDKIGEKSAFRTSDYAVMVTYEDGTSEEIGGDNLMINLNGNRVYSGGEYEKNSFANDIYIYAGEFSVTHREIMPVPNAATPADGWYNLQVLGNYINLTTEGNAEIRKKAKNQAFYVENKGNNQITLKMANGSYLGVNDAKNNGARLKATKNPYIWNTYIESKGVFNLKAPDNIGMIVNASEEKNTDGTAIILWTHWSYDAPKNAEVKFISTTAP